MDDTIFALASGAGRAGIAVVRASGPLCAPALEALAGSLPVPRLAGLRALKSADGALIDRALVLWFPAPASFTGEDVAEFHIHGGLAVIAALSDALMAQGLRPAGPGEFTRRAFERGRLDLTEAEGLADLIDAETEAQRAQALAQMGGALSGLYAGWRDQLIDILSSIEGEIDFPDEEDVPENLAARAGPPLDGLIDALESHLADGRRGEQVREGFTIAIIGAPNAGKSSLLNHLARREAAIVSDIPGTTRDVVEVRDIRAGFVVLFADTAGLREAADAIEAEGVKRALARAEGADLRCLVLDVSRETLSAESAHLLRPGDVVLANKADLSDRSIAAPEGVRSFAVSVRSGAGLGVFEAWLDGEITRRLGAREAVPLSRVRHRQLVERALESLVEARHRLATRPELAGAEVNRAIRALGELTGAVSVEDVLDRVFSQFCIGK
ncbi:MAG: tRNA uridine-5-carboxymethylaminomethyl(34) synthesis GTPase MnmE [Oceanicaulis sp.]|uniref:tRNA uridine-5-carboxymethylaminomethyl(34) synthesis GTPase MnmE n=1 Tax=Glycocaulis sp. TaxID=1969725 RepID=UPI0025C06B9F|nr:tRNA uridine-5-carboxymethylaminomethyl(34) synthesis GTPase MnmE [Glycocaulis sp.]MCC5981999.1 tRNA uridine-5-carboxymethylaminomethyl(34) synthesis GTPase MnmE [Oceanicaulis sp.]MCH8521982.1 tRNA uridine-5-carboxymethylaminomethyl(34) synthesis GTPase MnmE [Glycocaulis sp.]